MSLREISESTGMSLESVRNYCYHIYRTKKVSEIGDSGRAYLTRLLTFVAVNFPGRGKPSIANKIMAYNRAATKEFNRVPTMTERLTAAVESGMKNTPVNPDTEKEIVETIGGQGITKLHACPYIAKLLAEKDSEILRFKRRAEELNLENSALISDIMKVSELMAALKKFKL